MTSPPVAIAVALIATVLNEAETIDALLTSVQQQSRPPSQIVIVDGGSVDGTWEKLLDWRRHLPLTALREPGASISRGRNLAIARTQQPLIAVTDAGVKLDPRWLEHLLAQASEADVVAGFFRSAWRSPFQAALGATVLPVKEDIRPQSFLPSSRSLLVRRSAWQAVGGYPEWLDYCEDLVFDLALHVAGFRFAFAPAAVAEFQPRSSVGAFFRQYYLYARGDGKADLWRKRHAIRYLTYLLAPVLLVQGRARVVLVLLAAAALYVRRPYQRLLPALEGMSGRERLSAIAWVPALRCVGDVAKMVGYPVGAAWRLRHRPRP